MDPKDLKSVPLFASLSDDQLRLVAQQADEVDVREGKQLTTEGRFAYEFFAIHKLGAFATLYAVFVVPRLRDGQLLALCLGAFIALVFVVFFTAAITFSRDVLLDRWP